MPWGSVAGLEEAGDVDAVARAVLRRTAGASAGPLRGSVRSGVALTEGGGRRLLFTASDRGGATDGVPADTADAADAADAAGGAEPLDWCHIDAYDDVPLTRALRSGRPVAGDLAALDLDPEFVARQQRAGVSAVVAAPLLRPGSGERLGGLVVFLDRTPGPDAVAEVQAAAAEVAAALLRLRGSSAPADGQVGAVAPDRRTAWLRLPGEPRDASRARAFVRDRVATWQVPGDLLDAALLCVSELVTNAVVHTGATTDVDLAWEEGRLVLGVRDYGVVAVAPERLEAAGEADALPVFGRGLALVAALSARWGVQPREPGLRVWCEIGP